MDVHEDRGDETGRLRAAGTDRDRVLGEIFEEHRARLLRMVELRMDPRLKARLGASDVLQDAFVEVRSRLEDYLVSPRMPFFLWLRETAAQRLSMLYRHHIGTQKRDARRQVSLARGAFPAATSVALVDRLFADQTTPTTGAARLEMRAQLEQFLERMSPADREVLVLRHFEELSNTETAQELGIDESAASKRYIRALKRLRASMEEAGGTAEDGDA